jgi:hypothetical protein
VDRQTVDVPRDDRSEDAVAESEAEAHRPVDVLGAGDAGVDQVVDLPVHRVLDAIDQHARDVAVQHQRHLAHLLHPAHEPAHRRRRRVLGAGHLDGEHHVRGDHEVQPRAALRPAQDARHIADPQPGRDDQRARAHATLDLGEQPVLEGEVLADGLDDQLDAARRQRLDRRAHLEPVSRGRVAQPPGLGTPACERALAYRRGGLDRLAGPPGPRERERDVRAHPAGPQDDHPAQGSAVIGRRGIGPARRARPGAGDAIARAAHGSCPHSAWMRPLSITVLHCATIARNCLSCSAGVFPIVR